MGRWQSCRRALQAPSSCALALAALALLHAALPCGGQHLQSQPATQAAESLCAKKPLPRATLASGMTWGGNMVKVYHNLYHHNGKWYSLIGPDSNISEVDTGMSINYLVIRLPTSDAAKFAANLKQVSGGVGWAGGRQGAEWDGQG